MKESDSRVPLRDLLDLPIESRENVIVTMQNMHQPAGAPLEADVEVSRYALVRIVPMESDAPVAQLPNDGCRIVLGRAIVDDFNLHLARSRVLRQDAFETWAQIPGAVEGGDHHRPQRPVSASGNRLDLRSP